MEERNSKNEIELRKYQSILTSVGTGIMIFAIWTFIKMIGLWMIEKQEILEFIGGDSLETLSEADAAFVANIIAAIIGAVLLIAIIIQIYVGRSAIAVGRDGKNKKAYLVFAFLMAVSSLLSVVQIVSSIFTGKTSTLPYGLEGSIIVELTSFIMICELIYASFKVKKLSSAGKHYRGQHAA